MPEIAIIGGTGVYDPSILTDIHDDSITTPFGEVSFKTGIYNGVGVAFIPRHGSHHSIPPHKINYRANIWAIKKIGVKKIFATTAVGSLNPSMKPGDFVLIDQFLDFTKNRITTFFEGKDGKVVHADVSEPYCPHLRQVLKKAAGELGITAHMGGTYVCTEGPRFETPAEIKMYARFGGDLVGMTNVPEVTLAHEAEMCYATVSMVTNQAAGISQTPLTHAEVVATMEKNGANIKNLIMKSIELLTSVKEECHCASTIAEFGGFNI